MNSMRWLAVASFALLCTPSFGCSGTDNSCPDGFVACNGVCTDFATSRDNCGGCGESCSDGEVCSAGTCATSCSVELTECSGSCRDTNNNPSHCGRCDNVCGQDEVCTNGSCAPTGTMCSSGTVECAGACVDTDRDTQNCGDCGVVCGPLEQCSAGNCEVSCGPGTELCGTTCAATQTDLNNCGGCGVFCGADEGCVGGNCVISCGGAAPTECNGVCTNLDLDPSNCGGCGTLCGANEVCSAGSCTGAGCQAPLTQCGQSCTSTTTDTNNCGVCGVVCAAPPASAPVCLGGACEAVCASGFADCNADLSQSNSDGCETDVVNRVDNCGGCGIVCDVPNATPQCVAGSCEVDVCSFGFDDCDSNIEGCEQDVSADPNNCGACGRVCGPGLFCVNATCGQPTGEDCALSIPLLPGATSVNWTATTQDYFAGSTPSCVSFGAAAGPDVVMSYQATVSGFATLSMQKTANNRHFFMVSDATCGTVTPELACASEFTPTSMSDTFAVTAGTTYTVYFSDHDSGAAALPNPLELSLSEISCASVNVAALSLDPVAGSTTSVLNPTFSVVFDGAVNTTSGVLSIVGSMGTSLSYDLSLNPPEVSFSARDTTLTVNPGINFVGGEVVTVSVTGLVDALCGTAVAAVNWQSTIITPPCQPGVNQMVGSTVTAFATTSNLATEYYMAADTSSVGWVYFGGTTQLLRARKTGGTAEVLPVNSADLGYDMLVDGLNIFTLDSASTGTVGHVSRISDDGGATIFAPQDVMGLPAAAGDDFRAIAAFGGLVYVMTHEASSTANTEIYAFDPSTATINTPAAATLVGTFSGEANCSGLALDAAAYYTVCSTGERVIRVDRGTGTVTLLSAALDASGTTNAVHGRDIDQDGIFDFLYLQTWYREGYFVCGPNTATPFVGTHFVFGGGSLSNYGMGYDGGQNALWMYNDGTDEIVRIQ